MFGFKWEKENGISVSQAFNLRIWILNILDIL